MADGDNPEFIAFQRCNDILQAVKHGLEPILDRASANGLILDVLKNKCLDKNICPEDRTRRFLTAIQDRIKCLPKTFHSFVEILKQDPGDYIGNELMKKLTEVMEARVQQASDNFAGVLVPTPPTLPLHVYMIANERRAGVPVAPLCDGFSSGNISSFYKQAGAGARASTPPPTPSKRPPDLRTRLENCSNPVILGLIRK